MPDISSFLVAFHFCHTPLWLAPCLGLVIVAVIQLDVLAVLGEHLPCAGNPWG